jgi:predicted MFS family arabinose efflux permease
MTPASARRAWTITASFTAVIAATYAFGVYLFPLLLPDMKGSLGFSYADAGAIAALRQVAFLVTALLSATATLRFGAGAVILGSVVTCGLALSGLAMPGSLWATRILLIVLNACAASAWIPMVSLITQIVDYRHQGKAVGLIASGTNYGLCINGLIVPGILSMWGWRSVWLVAGGLTLLLACSLWLTLARASLIYGAPKPLKTETVGRSGWRVVARAYLVVYSLAFLGGLAGVSSANYLSAYLRANLHLSVAIAGQAWLAMGIGGATGGVVFGAIGDRFGLRSALAIASGLLATSAILAAMGKTSAALVSAGFCFGGSFFSIFGLLPAYVGKTSESSLTPVICSLVECALGIGGALGSFVGGLAPQVFGSFRPVYISAGAVAGFMIWLSFMLPAESRPHSRSRAVEIPGT